MLTEWRFSHLKKGKQTVVFSYLFIFSLISPLLCPVFSSLLGFLVILSIILSSFNRTLSIFLDDPSQFLDFSLCYQLLFCLSFHFVSLLLSSRISFSSAIVFWNLSISLRVVYINSYSISLLTLLFCCLNFVPIEIFFLIQEFFNIWVIRWYVELLWITW
jgi:hypothetical protein